MGWIVVILALMIPLIAVVLDSHLGRALADYVTRRGGSPPLESASNQRLLALESELERLSGEVQRLEEETQFLHRLLEAKPSSRGELPPGTERS
jgi:hypothetical protein